MNLKVSVLSNGSILLDGMPVALSNLKAALEQAGQTTGSGADVFATPNQFIAIIRPDLAVVFLTLPPPPPRTSLMAKQLASVIPSDRGRSIAVIGATTFTMTQAEAMPTLQDANRAIPFFGILCGLIYIGHRIWIFEGHPSALAAGLEQSEILIVDSAMLPFLQPDWAEVAQKVMQGDRRIFIHERESGRLLARKP